jgi:YVTN family beta-propeller protein
VINTTTNTVTATITVGTYPWSVAVTPNGEYAYVTNEGGNTVSVINTATNTVTATITVGNYPRCVAITPDGAYAYVTNNDPVGTVSIINTATNAVTATVTVGSLPDSVAITPNGEYAYVTNNVSGTISVISTTTSTATPTSTPAPSPGNTTTPTPTPTPLATTVPATTDNGAKVNFAISGNITSSQMSNISIASNQSATTTTLSFIVTGESGTVGFGNITIPKSAVPYGTTPTIYIDGQPALNQGFTQDSNNYYVWYTTHFSTHQISIVFTTATSPHSSNTQSSLLQAVYGSVAAVAIVGTVLGALYWYLGKPKEIKHPR